MWHNKVKYIPFETYMDQDMRELNISGVLDAWIQRKRMQRGVFIGHSEAKVPLDDGVYEIQISQWFQGLEIIGRDSRTQVHFI